MSALTQKLQDTYGHGRWQGTPSGIVVNGQLVIPQGQIGAWLKGQFVAYTATGGPPPVMPPIARPKPRYVPQPMETAPTPMPFAKPPPKAKPVKTKALVCSKCKDAWEDCECGQEWCPYCGYEPPSGTRRGLDMHVKAAHKEIDWV